MLAAVNGPATKKKKKKRERSQKAKQSTAVYVTGLPLDANEGEVKDVFSKCGLILEDVDTGEKRVKLYKDDAGNPKGDAMIIYFRPEKYIACYTDVG